MDYELLEQIFLFLFNTFAVFFVLTMILRFFKSFWDWL